MGYSTAPFVYCMAVAFISLTSIRPRKQRRLIAMARIDQESNAVRRRTCTVQQNRSSSMR
jgi:hypothetical protein